jgi:hypothetical protein
MNLQESHLQMQAVKAAIRMLPEKFSRKQLQEKLRELPGLRGIVTEHTIKNVYSFLCWLDNEGFIKIQRQETRRVQLTFVVPALSK